MTQVGAVIQEAGLEHVVTHVLSGHQVKSSEYIGQRNTERSALTSDPVFERWQKRHRAEIDRRQQGGQ